MWLCCSPDYSTATPTWLERRRRRVTGAYADGGTAWFRAEARVDRTWFGVTRKKAIVGREVMLSIVARADRA